MEVLDDVIIFGEIILNAQYYKNIKKQTKCEDPSDCKNLHEDYNECLHHTKEVFILFFQKLKMNAIELQRRRVFSIMKDMDKARKQEEKKQFKDEIERDWRERAGRQKN